MAKQKKRINIVSVHLTPQGKAKLDKVCADRGMTIKSLLGRLIDWLVQQDKTSQAIVLGQVEARDVRDLGDLIGGRSTKKTAAGAGRRAR